HGNSAPSRCARGRQTQRECQMSDHDSNHEIPASAPGRGVWYASEGHDPTPPEIPGAAPQSRRPRRSGPYIVAAVAGVALIGAFVSSPLGQGLGHRMLANVPGMAAAAAPFEGRFGVGFAAEFAADWQSRIADGAIEAIVEARADRMIRHL